MQSKIPNLGRYDDISDVLVAGGNASESSEGEDEDAKVQLPQSISSRGNVAAQVSIAKITNLGSRYPYRVLTDLFLGCYSYTD